MSDHEFTVKDVAPQTPPVCERCGNPLTRIDRVATEYYVLDDRTRT